MDKGDLKAMSIEKGAAGSERECCMVGGEKRTAAGTRCGGAGTCGPGSARLDPSTVHRQHATFPTLIASGILLLSYAYGPWPAACRCRVTGQGTEPSGWESKCTAGRKLYC